MPEFPRIPLCAFAGAFRDSSLFERFRCVGAFAALPQDSIREEPRTVTVRFRRDRRVEVRPDFGGYRIYRVETTPDTTRMVLIRRFSRQVGDERTWNFSVVDPGTLQFMCGGEIVADSIVTFIDPDSNGNYVKRCRLVDHLGRCITRGDSIIILQKPPGPHDGFRIWYSITYEGKNVSLDGNYQDLFVPDLTGQIGPCGNPADPKTCPNLNHKAYNLASAAVEPTGGPTRNLERVAVVPNPYRAHEAWDQPGAHELHFINLPAHAVIRIYTSSGDLVAELQHDDRVRDFERWNLKNQDGRDVSSGIYMFRVEAEQFSFQNRFVVIR